MTSLRRYLPLLAVGLLLLGAALAATLATPQIRPVNPPRPNLPTMEEAGITVCATPAELGEKVQSRL